jgi:hypothetical protein
MTVETHNLPLHCPRWCEGGHKEALAEGNSVEDSAEHLRGAGGGQMLEMRNPVDGRVTRPYIGGWNLSIRQRPFPNGMGLLTEETINVELDTPLRTIPLTSGEARILSRQLERLADLIDGVEAIR